MLEMFVPEIPLASLKLVRIESVVTFQVLVESRVNAAVLIEPVRLVLFSRVTEIELMLSLIMLPPSISSFAVNTTVPPFDPLVPQLPVAADRRMPDVAVIWALFFSVITAFVFVT